MTILDGVASDLIDEGPDELSVRRGCVTLRRQGRRSKRVSIHVPLGRHRPAADPGADLWGVDSDFEAQSTDLNFDEQPTAPTHLSLLITKRSISSASGFINAEHARQVAYVERRRNGVRRGDMTHIAATIIPLASAWHRLAETLQAVRVLQPGSPEVLR